jgi:ribose transport system substrate-binding protein
MRSRRTRGPRIVPIVLAAVALAAGACSSGSDPAAEGAQQFRFEDTGTFNRESPEAPTVEGPDLHTLGDVPKLDADVKIGILIKSLTNQYWQQVEAGIKEAKTRFGVDTSPVQSASDETNTSEQLQICQTMLLQDYDAFIVSPQTTSNLTPCITQMKQQNIPVVNIAAPGDGLPATAYVGSALLDDGRLAAKYLADTLPPGSEVAHIEGLPGSSASDLRKRGYALGIASSQLKPVADVAGNWDAQEAFRQTQDLLSKHPNLRGIYAANDTMATAVSRAVAQSGRPDSVVIVGTDGIPLAIDGLRKRTLAATITPFPYYQGYWSLEAAVRLLGGQDVPLWVKTPDVVVTQENVGQYYTDDGTAKSDLFAQG